MRRLWVVLAATLVLGAGALWLTRSRDDDHIRGQLARLAAALHATSASNVLVRTAKLHGEFGAVFDESPHVTIPDLPFPMPDDRSALADRALALASLATRLDVELGDLEIKIDDAHTSAEVNTTATLQADGDSPRRISRPVTFLMWKRDGTWRISAVTVWGQERAQ